MVTISLFVLAVLTLLVVPGPTNTLLAASGAVVGISRSLRLLPMELGGYLLSIGIWRQVVGPLAAPHGLIPTVLKLSTSAYLIWSAINLWQKADRELASTKALVSPWQVFITTLLNPKALIFALVIFPPGDLIGQFSYVIMFSGMIVSIACCWIGFGKLIMQSSQGSATPALVSRLAALAIRIFAFLLANSAIGVM